MVPWSMIGEWAEDVFHGKGTLVQGLLKCSGSFVSGELHGNARGENKQTRSSYVAEWRCGQRHGHGSYVLPYNQGTYDGDWRRDHRTGFRTLTLAGEEWETHGYQRY